MHVGPVLLRWSLPILTVIASAAARAAADTTCRASTADGAPQVFRTVNPDDPVLRAALDLLQPFMRSRPAAATFNASDYPDWPLAGLSGVCVCVDTGAAVVAQIYINTETNMFRLAARGVHVGLIGVAATVFHETRHAVGAGEAEAYTAEAAFVSHWLATQSLRPDERQLLQRFVAALHQAALGAVPADRQR